jgi:hypothetical protein
MRLIDADKLQPDRFSDKTGFSVSCDLIYAYECMKKKLI